MQKHHKFSIWYVLLGVWVVLIVQNYLASTFAIPMEGRGEYSETTAELIDEEVRAIISDQYEKAFGILKEKTEILEKGAVLLLEKEKIEGGEIKALMGVGPETGSPDTGQGIST